MFSTGYVVLVVDDEPDVLQVSKLAMRTFEVLGLPIELHTASSKAEAVELYETSLSTHQGTSGVAVAFIDVVMESDDAGLELCEYIREERGNGETQLFVRTGQPGMAPERSVIDRYDISGYFTKLETTDDKLYSLTKCGVRQFEVLSTGRVIRELTVALVEARSREEVAGVLERVIGALVSDASGRDHQLVDPRVAFLADGDVVARHPSWSEAEILSDWERMGEDAGTALGNDGDKYVVGGGTFLLRVAEGPGNSEFGYMARVPGEVPDTFPAQLYGLARPAAVLWERGGE